MSISKGSQQRQWRKLLRSIQKLCGNKARREKVASTLIDKVAVSCIRSDIPQLMNERYGEPGISYGIEQNMHSTLLRGTVLSS